MVPNFPKVNDHLAAELSEYWNELEIADAHVEDLRSDDCKRTKVIFNGEIVVTGKSGNSSLISFCLKNIRRDDRV